MKKHYSFYERPHSAVDSLRHYSFRDGFEYRFKDDLEF